MLSVKSARSLCGAYLKCVPPACPRSISLASRVNSTSGAFPSSVRKSASSRAFHATQNFYNIPANTEITTSGAEAASRSKTDAEIEVVAKRARETFGETLPADFLSPEEYIVYERLYGPPLRETTHEDAELLQGFDSADVQEEDATRRALFRENEDGELEEVEFEPDTSEEAALEEGITNETTDELDGEVPRLQSEDAEEFRARVMLFKDIAAATKAAEAKNATTSTHEEATIIEDEIDNEESQLEPEEIEEDMDPFDEGLEGEEEHNRAHPATVEGRFATYPSTIYLPPESLVDPIASIISDTPNKHLAEAALRTFGGDLLPDSVATPSTSRHLQQKPIALVASQYQMSDIEANLYLAANIPGAYATIMSTLMETRRRLGSEWLESLLSKPDGPRILDAGAAGAGALACHEMFRAEWERMHPENPSDNLIPTGKTTVVVGSSELRRRVSRLLENTTFLPRLPNFLASRDLPGSEAHHPALRKQFDIIIAPHTLWPLKEDYMRKAQVQNLWCLLNPNGGVLIIIEKGVPRGFEIVANARAMLLKRHVSSPGDEIVENEVEAPAIGRFDKKETGMIIAPCTNHSTCPMYKTPGQMQGRKDHCHFSQRFIRPPFLQRLVGASHQNHEDIRFSYVAFQRGIDKREVENFVQGEDATKAALTGFEELVDKPNMLTLPRILLPPLKRHKHVTFDVCTPSAQLERWTIPKSFSKQGYRDARKSRWGDLWALGAKTRVLRTARSGSLKGDNRRPRVIEVGVGANESEDTLREVTPARDPYYKKGKKTKRVKKPRKLTEDDIL